MAMKDVGLPNVTVPTHSLPEALDAEGFPLPEMCREARLIAGTDSAIYIQFDCFVSPDRLAQFGRALQRVARATPKPGEIRIAPGPEVSR